MDSLFLTVGDLNDPRLGAANSFTDRLNCCYTVFVLITFAVVVTTKHYVGDPISCWCDSHYTEAQRNYANKICWVTNTYYLPNDEELPREGEPKRLIGYYQWVGLLMICQAMMFYIPGPIWKIFNRKSGISVTTITDASIECQKKSDSESREKTLRYMTKHMGRFLKEVSRQNLMAESCKSLRWKFYGNFLICFYIIIKIVYIGNVIGQLFLLNAFLGTEHQYYIYGFKVLKSLLYGEPVSSSDRFPRVTFCEFYIRVVGNVQRHTVQCALPINLFNEKIYIFIWFWFVFVAITTAGSLAMWVFRCSCFGRHVNYIKRRLLAMERLKGAPDDLVRSFVEDFLQGDGMFIIWMVAKNSSDLIAAELICGLWDHYKECKRSVERLSSRDELEEKPTSKTLHDVIQMALNPGREEKKVHFQSPDVNM